MSSPTGGVFTVRSGAGVHSGSGSFRGGPTALPTDRVRLRVALYKMARALGLPAPDPSRPDHELLEEIAEAVTPALAAVWRTAQCEALLEETTTENPYDQAR